MKLLAPLLVAGAALALPLAPAAAQAIQPDMAIAPGQSLLTVSGEGRSYKEPDMAVFTAGVTSQGRTAAEALASNARSMEQVIAALKRAGIAERDIQTSNLSINPVYRDPNREAAMAARAGQPYVAPAPEDQIPTIIGYQANNSVSVRQRKLGDYGKVIDTLAAAGANQINGPNFQLDEPGPALDEARKQAVAEARDRAQLYANALGLRIVRVVSLNESGGYYAPQPRMFGESAMRAPPAPPPPPSAVLPGEMQMTASVTIQYELAP